MKIFYAHLFALISTLIIQAEDKPSFYVFQNGVNFGAPAQEAKTIKELGFDGISQVFRGGPALTNRLPAYDKEGIKVLSIYLDVSDKPLAHDLIKPLANRKALIELTISKITPQTVQAVRKTTETAAALNIKVALYPHFGLAVATIPQALDLIAKVDHPNLGVMFNLCHFLKGEQADQLETVLTKAAPHLFAVSISGAKLGAKSWDDLIKPLDQGDFPQERLLLHLQKINFTGPICLQCFGIKGDKLQNLKNAIKAWDKLHKNSHKQVGTGDAP